MFRRITYLFSILLLVASANFAQSNNGKGREVLNKWEGTWQTETLYKKSAWISKRSKVKGVSTVSFLLDGAYQQMITQDSAASTFEVNRYDASNERYQKWVYDQDGTTSVWYGSWNESKNRMTWKYIDLAGAGIEGTITEQFKNENELMINIELVDFKGNTLLEFKTTQTK